MSIRSGVLVFAMTAAGLLLAPTSAQAAVVGTAAVNPPTGTADVTRPTVEASAPCPAGTNVVTRIFGPGFPAAGENIAPSQPIANLGTNANGGVIVPTADTFRTFANLQNPPATLNGRYDITISCVQPLTPNTSLGDFTGPLWFVNHP